MKLVILERDGVINKRPTEGSTPADTWTPIAGSIDALARLHRQGFTVILATNQSGLAEGLLDLDELEAVHSQLTEAVEAAGGELGAIFYCPHGPDDHCKCRKPQAGMLDAIEAEFNTSVAGAAVIGDGLEDIQAALAKGGEPLLVKTGRGAETLAALQSDKRPELEDLKVFDNLAAAVDYLVQQPDGT
jgi:D-glycero-D-manno-heptose 1,7-bisphosphate phosphatase